MSDRTTSRPAPDNATLVTGVTSDGGVHCETTTLGVLLAAAGIELSEPMIFGLGSGLSFVYWDSKKQKLPFLGGRVKPFVLTRNLTSRLGIELGEHQTSSATKAWDQVRAAVDGGTPVGLQLDSYHLDYFTPRIHFAGHVLAMYGYDDETAYVVDTAQQGGRVSTSLDSLAAARAAHGPMAARHRSFTLRPGSARFEAGVPVPTVLAAIKTCAEDFLSPPIANLGNRGIGTAAIRMRAFLERTADPRRDLPEISEIMERGGTGGSLFRNLYVDFLTETHALLPTGSVATSVAAARDEFAESADLWARVAELIASAGTTGDHRLLAEASEHLVEIADLENAAMRVLCEL